MSIIRPFRAEDAHDFAHYANNYYIARFLTNGFPHPYSLANAHDFIQKAIQDQPTTLFAITDHDKLVGAIGLHPQSDIFNKNMELGYWIAQPFWGKGIATQAVSAIVAYGFETFDINRIFARPFGTNIGSQRVLEKAGFVLEATLPNTIYKNGEYFDEMIYAIRPD